MRFPAVGGARASQIHRRIRLWICLHMSDSHSGGTLLHACRSCFSFFFDGYTCRYLISGPIGHLIPWLKVMVCGTSAQAMNNHAPSAVPSVVVDHTRRSSRRTTRVARHDTSGPASLAPALKTATGHST